MLIATFDGGGFRGLYTAETLRLLEETESFLSEVALFSGTSTGSFLALALAQGLQPERIVNLYRQRGPEIFQSRGWWDDWTSLDELVRADFDAKGLYEVLEEILGDGVWVT